MGFPYKLFQFEQTSNTNTTTGPQMSVTVAYGLAMFKWIELCYPKAKKQGTLSHYSKTRVSLVLVQHILYVLK